MTVEFQPERGNWIIVLALAAVFVAGVWVAFSYRREIFLVLLIWVAVLANYWKYWIVPIILMAVYMYRRKSQ